jgi:hypothetical protein
MRGGTNSWEIGFRELHELEELRVPHLMLWFKAVNTAYKFYGARGQADPIPSKGALRSEVLTKD